MGLRHYIQVILILWISSLCKSHVNKTNGLFYKLGKLSTGGDIELEYGVDPLNATCTINNDNTEYDSGMLIFKIGKILVDKKWVRIIDNKSSQIFIPKPEMTKSAYLACYVNDIMADMNFLVVGTKPQKIEGFKCIGYNFNNVTCTWNKDVTSNYEVTYTLRYSFKNIDDDISYEALTSTEINKVEKIVSVWNMSTLPQLRIAHDDIYFNITATNKLGSISEKFHVKQHEIMKSDAPINLTVGSVKERSMELIWEIPFGVTLLTYRRIQYRVMVTCEYWNMTFKQVAVFQRNINGAPVRYNLTNLPYAFTLYDIRVGIKLSKYDTEEMWSANASVTNYTASLAPATAPRASRTGFYLSPDEGVVTIYWTQVDKRYRNGPDFEYVITSYQNGTIVTLKERTRSNAHVQYENVASSASYKFKIESKNSMGKSKNASYIHIPPKRRITLHMAEPVQTEYSDVLYQLSWEPPTAGADLLTNYTVYWCIAQKEAASHLCDGILEFETVPKTTLKYNVTIPNKTNVQLAISANGEKHSSGMVWAECRIHHSNVQYKIKKIWVDHVNSSSITLRWQLLCEHKTGNIKGYYVEYCPTNPTGLECVKKDIRNHTLPGANHEMVTIGDLEPYSSYQLRVFTMDSMGTYGKGSEWLANTTFDGTPTSPYALNITETTNTSITVQWFAPLKKNGIVSKYIIYYNDKSDIMDLNIDTTQPIPDNATFTINKLQSFQDYNISVAACIRERCSNRSNMVQGRTDVGAPGKIENITFHERENKISWDPPSRRGGNIDYYEVQLKRHPNDKDAIIKTTNRSSYVLVECENGRIYYRVRAVNVFGKNRYHSEWSQREDSQHCHGSAVPLSFIIPIVVVLALGLLGAALFTYKYLLKYLRRMKDVQYELPNGLTMTRKRLPSTDPQFLLGKPPIGPGGITFGQESNSECDDSISSRRTESSTARLRDDSDNSFQMQHLNDDNYDPTSKSSGGNYVSVFGVSPESETENVVLSDTSPVNDVCTPCFILPKTNLTEEQLPSIKRPVNTGYTPVEPTPSYVMAMSPVSENKGYVPNTVPTNFPFTSIANTVNDQGADKGYVHASYNPELTGNSNLPKIEFAASPPHGNGSPFKVSTGYVSCTDSTGTHPVAAEATSSGYVMHKQFEQMPNN